MFDLESTVWNFFWILLLTMEEHTLLYIFDEYVLCVLGICLSKFQCF